MPKIYQIFIGCPFAKDIRKAYDRLKKDVETDTPLAIILADTVGISSSDYLLEHITGVIRDSAGCIFDATGANPNVSLEVGIAHTIPVDFILALKTRKPRHTPDTQIEVRSIISDLQGKNRIEYKSFESLKSQLMERYLINQPYMKRWRQFQRENSGMAPLVLKLFSDLRSSGRSTSARLTAILEGSGFRLGDVTKSLVKAKLIQRRTCRRLFLCY
ncbi:MAG: hypothetical protein MUQ00_06185 [Candidatus Aminicenantes bacterium]|nr:hypothetical protein [Candidatus Aminicenantes bacterium]